jgi:probable rRNA maturation factor
MSPSPDTLSIDVIVQSPLWEAHPGAEALLRAALFAAAATVSTRPAELAIVLTDDSAIRALNRNWRGIDKPTNVLSFPVQQRPLAPVAASEATAPPILLGDIVIAFETTMQEARNESKRFEDHLTHLAVHGFLHLLGQDHDTDSDAAAMEELERAILGRLGIADPYVASDLVPAARPHA